MKLRNKKTGEVVEVNALGLVFNRHNQPFDLGKYASIEELTETWEDYTPTEPLIKDPKIRKAVRAWAEANGAWLLLVVSSYRIEISQVDVEILFNDPVFKELPRDRQLTVTELCGEEKE